VRWFPYGASGRADGPHATDREFLACAIAALDVDVLAVQEFVQDPEGRGALLDVIARLDQLSGGRYRAELDDCTGSRFQHVGFLFDSRRVEVTGARAIAAFNPGRSACDRSLRPGYAVSARFASGPDLQLLTVHLDSGETPRDFGHRAQFGAAFQLAQAELFGAQAEDRDLLVLGDFNSMGCSDCVPRVSAQEELARLDAEAAARALTRVPPRADLACSHYHRGEPALLDHVLARSGMEELPKGARVEVHGPCAELACGKVPRGEAGAYLETLSDHCPVVVELLPEDRDPRR
jgi:endonuclease/exonuclease/phosphatase family metal-dependent hydrolase